jgi:hypothetical protein
MDEIDAANTMAETYRQQALKGYFGRNSAQSGGVQQYPGAPATETRASSGPVLCIDCGEEIEPARLKALPAAVRCTACQEKQERRSRMSGSEPGPRRWPVRRIIDHFADENEMIEKYGETE